MTKQELKTIVEKNNSRIRQRIADHAWNTRYRKDSDMLIMGEDFPKGSFYTYVDKSGVMLRIDNDGIIYGYAIENTKHFIKKNPEVGFIFYPIVYPIRAKILFHLWKIVGNISDKMRISTATTYVNNSICYA